MPSEVNVYGVNKASEMPSIFRDYLENKEP